MKKRIVGVSVLGLIAGFLFIVNTASAQRYKDREPGYDNDYRQSYDSPDSLATQSFAQRLVKGANLWLDISPAYIEVSPILGYRLTTRLQAGIGATYIYYNGLENVYDIYGNFLGTTRIEGNMYGGRIYAEYDFIRDVFSRDSRIFAHAEYENMYVPYQTSTGVNLHTWMSSPYIGVGYRTPLGKKAFLNLTVLFNANYDQFKDINPFGSPIVERLGFTF